MSTTDLDLLNDAQLAAWADHTAVLTVLPSLDPHERMAWTAKRCVSCGLKETVRRVLLLESTGHAYLLTDERAKIMIARARAYAAQYGFSQEVTDGDE
jgi:hypothetical protein